ncbi:hypothetical protein [Streptomyces sp. RTd22]|uniref:hypothetical protein n=1 Tax=Streptomyces sp. RTd22 TaxID=1841249 RepID=UPI0007C44751|nr:hypothetical protein [Streptomyces sp. RTd22]
MRADRGADRDELQSAHAAVIRVGSRGSADDLQSGASMRRAGVGWPRTARRGQSPSYRLYTGPLGTRQPTTLTAR